MMSATLVSAAIGGMLSRQALDSERVRTGLKDLLLGPAQPYEALRDRSAMDADVDQQMET